MKQKKIGTTLYVFDNTAYQITEDTDATVIKIQEECISAYAKLNPTLVSKFSSINYKLYCVQKPEWADYYDDYTVSVSVTGNGAVSASPTSGDEGEEITLTVTPESGYEINTLTAVSGGTAITITDNKFTMPAGNVTVTASFQGQEFDITCAEATHGTVTAPSTARLGDTVTITTTPDTNYRLDTLTAMCGDVPVTITDSAFTMPAGDVTITATFVQDVNPYALQYFTIESLEDGNTLTLSSAVGGSYSTDGTNWESNAYGATINLDTGDKVMFKNTGNYFAQSGDGSFSDPIFGTTKTVNVYGNIMSLLYEDNFDNQTSLPLPSSFDVYGNFVGLLYGCKVVDASNLILPATTLQQNCYKAMFYGCSSLTTVPELPATALATGCYSCMFMECSSLTAAPVLPATTSAQNCYANMFDGCTLLDEVTMLLEDIPTTTGSMAPDYLYKWLNNCSTTGTAYVSPNLTNDQKTAISYSLPGGAETLWTIEDYAS